ncbi:MULTISPECIES: hypothetical protein [Metallosphaera]|uniref:PfkB domain protein n=4 Tax=Metallosphaera TaxID=41980 RepID=A4YD34_METS5|nr:MULTISPECIES: hypothetical protein [Metallosphaera]ABP94336.1 hypothetical protein Msed_0159 [Metallosphaera sedula DSM 5348]AIM26323.1 hypothetical protein HA72_0159 [Metallosphaera sedula]AKV75212.1 hypothetical protein MsedA_0167 [Metallosphaera sedula]AKV77448.1 hypothetical protein MsedB_0167 [Metallosphaera sedula]AKV79700.1 hypothetical protein MsedC_0166 [Metallosphaera sedula]
MRTKSKVAIVGAMTIDEIVNGQQLLERPGGAPVYSGLGVTMADGVAGGYVSVGKDFNYDIPSYLKIIEKIIFERTMRFLLVFNGNTRRLTLKFSHGKIPLHLEKLSSWDGILLNPVCGEISSSIFEFKAIAVDIQGFIRNCVEGQEISYTNKFNVRVKSELSVFHANRDELLASGLSICDLHEMGYQEIIISNGSDGFQLYTKNEELKLKPKVVGSYEVGNGDFLLSSYFTFRLNGADPKLASQYALELSEKFSTQGLNVLPR